MICEEAKVTLYFEHVKDALQGFVWSGRLLCYMCDAILILYSDVFKDDLCTKRLRWGTFSDIALLKMPCRAFGGL